MSTPHCNASLYDAAPKGMIMNSCKSILLSACMPPFITLNIGTGSKWAFAPPMYLNRGIPESSAADLAKAKETPRIALAPNLLLSSVPSRSIIT